MKKIARIAMFALLTAGGASTAQAGGSPKTLVVREGLTGAELEADGAICLKEAKAAEKGRPIAPMPPARGGLAASAATSAVAGALKGLSDMERFLAAHDACLDRLGYRQVRLTPEERKEYGALKGKQARLDYIVEFSRRAVETRRD
jgi:hypothetical protein